jgi:hypothetical protein
LAVQAAVAWGICTKASVLCLLSEMEEVILVKPVEDTDKEQHKKLRNKIKKIQAYGVLL